MFLIGEGGRVDESRGGEGCSGSSNYPGNCDIFFWVDTRPTMDPSTRPPSHIKNIVGRNIVAEI